MTDKIKVWKCEECDGSTMCLHKGQNKPDTCSFDQGLHSDPSSWQLSAERNPEPETQESNISKAMRLAGHLALNSGYNPENYQSPEVVICEFLNMEFGIRSTQIDASEMGVNIHEPHHQGNEGHTTAPPQAPDSDWGDMSKMSGLTEESRPIGGHDTPPRKRVKIIWSEVNADNVEIAAKLKNMDGVCISAINTINKIPVCDIPKSWLEDIPAEPVTAEKYCENTFDGYSDQRERKTKIDAFQAGEENNELRHAQQQSFDEWWGGDGACFADDIDFKVARMIWGASQINRSHDPTN